MSECCILSAANDLQHDHSKAEYIRFSREMAVNSILRRHVTTALEQLISHSGEIHEESMFIRILRDLLCPDYPSGLCLHFILPENSRQPKV